MKLKMVPLALLGRHVFVPPACRVMSLCTLALLLATWGLWFVCGIDMLDLARSSYDTYQIVLSHEPEILWLAMGLLAPIPDQFEHSDKNAYGRTADKVAPKHHEELTKIAYQDALTGLRNRRGLEEDFALILRDGFHLKTRAALILLDLDRFKFINDTLGHHAGDDILKQLAGRIRDITGENQVCYRLGGDEFVILWIGAPSFEKVDEFCKLIKTALRKPYSLENSDVESGGSIGITWQNSDDGSLGELLKRADLALYKAKSDAGTAHRFYCGQMEIESGRKREINTNLRQMILKCAFKLSYHPMAYVSNLAVDYLKVSASASSGHEDILLAQDYLHELRDSGLNIQFERAQLQQAIDDMVRSDRRYIVVLDMSVEQLLDRTFTSYISDLLQDNSIEASRLLLVFNQLTHPEKRDLVQKNVRELLTLGIRIGSTNLDIHNFATPNEQRLSRRYLMLSRNWSSKIASDPNAMQLLGNLVRLAEGTGQRVMLDGIDYHQQTKVLQEFPDLILKGEIAGPIKACV